ncbi:MAG: cation diffusion facilitator family transporter [Thermomicrobiales bacterium]
METNDRGIRALKISLVGLGATAIFQVIIVLISGSTALLADTIHNFGDAATSIPLWIAFSLQRRGATKRFTYGYGRTEDVAGVAIVLLIFVSACVAGYESIRKLIDPQPVTHLWWVAAAAIVGFLGNEAVGVFRLRVGNEIGSAALIADGQHSRVDGFTSLAVLAGAIGVALGAPILDPLIGLAITIAILFIVKDAAGAVFLRLLDGVEPAILAEVEHAPLHVPGVQDVHAVRARWLGHRVQADIHITVDRRLSVAESHRIVERVQRALADHVPAFGGATVHVCPCAHVDPVGARAEALT